MKPGDRVRWRGVNRDYSGEIVGFRGLFAIARIDGSRKVILLENETMFNPNISREKDAAR